MFCFPESVFVFSIELRLNTSLLIVNGNTPGVKQFIFEKWMIIVRAIVVLFQEIAIVM